MIMTFVLPLMVVGLSQQPVLAQGKIGFGGGTRSIDNSDYEEPYNGKNAPMGKVFAGVSLLGVGFVTVDVIGEASIRKDTGATTYSGTDLSFGLNQFSVGARFLFVIKKSWGIIPYGEAGIDWASFTEKYGSEEFGGDVTGSGNGIYFGGGVKVKLPFEGFRNWSINFNIRKSSLKAKPEGLGRTVDMGGTFIGVELEYYFNFRRSKKK